MRGGVGGMWGADRGVWARERASERARERERERERESCAQGLMCLHERVGWRLTRALRSCE